MLTVSQQEAVSPGIVSGTAPQGPFSCKVTSSWIVSRGKRGRSEEAQRASVHVRMDDLSSRCMWGAVDDTAQSKSGAVGQRNVGDSAHVYVMWHRFPEVCL